MTRGFVGVVALLGWVLVWTPLAAHAKSPFLPELLTEVEAKYSKAKTLSAKFVQVNFTKATGQTKRAEGTLRFQRPDKIRWETRSPDRSELVSDGKTTWFYTPPFDESENGQVIIRKSSALGSELAHALLSGSFAATQQMKIGIDGATRFTLTPKSGAAGTVKRARIEIEPRAKLIQRIEIENRGGNRSEITLSEIRLGDPIDAERFIFEVPKNTDVIKR